MLIRFFGHSDDILEAELVSNTDVGYESCSPDGNPGFCVSLETGESFKVLGHYGKDGCWSIGIAPMEEGRSIPEMSVVFEQNLNGYSSSLIIDIPNNSVMFPIEDRNNLKFFEGTNI
jgi:hypothetical protein